MAKSILAPLVKAVVAIMLAAAVLSMVGTALLMLWWMMVPPVLLWLIFWGLTKLGMVKDPEPADPASEPSAEPEPGPKPKVELLPISAKFHGNELWDADPNCQHVVFAAPGGGIKCHRCPGWFCY